VGRRWGWSGIIIVMKGTYEDWFDRYRESSLTSRGQEKVDLSTQEPALCAAPRREIIGNVLTNKDTIQGLRVQTSH
jgi:hypothetical protein